MTTHLVASTGCVPGMSGSAAVGRRSRAALAGGWGWWAVGICGGYADRKGQAGGSLEC